MNTSIAPRELSIPRRKTHVLPAIVAVGFIALVLYSSRASVRPEPENGRLASSQDEPSTRTSKAVTAANQFLNTLDDGQRARALLEFDSDKRSRWSNLPVTMVKRNGVELGELTKGQHEAALGVIAAVLSKQGYQKVLDIMNGDQVLASRGGGKGKGKGKGPGGMFGNQKYYIAIFGKPSATKPWLVQFGGHHLGLNVTVVGKNFVLTPTHTGTQPAVFTWEDKGVRPLGAENDRAFQLVNSLDENQKTQAILGPRPQNLVLGPGEDGKTIKPQGVKGAQLTRRQQEILLDLIGAWVRILDDKTAAARMAEIKARLDDTYFAWAGPTTNGSAVYFRVQGPTLVIEYAPQQGSTDHIHTIIRDPSNDYGEKLTKR